MDYEYKIVTTLRGIYFVFYTASGLFSPTKIDFGTKLLIEHMVLRPDDIFLDLGCGYGPIGIVASKFVKEVHMVDIDKKALYYARLNAKINGCKNVKIYRSDLFSNIKYKFTNIVTNPPISSGKDVVSKIIKESYNYLEKDGLFQIVLRRGQNMYYNLMKEIYNEVEILKKKSGYWIIVGKKY